MKIVIFCEQKRGKKRKQIFCPATLISQFITELIALARCSRMCVILSMRSCGLSSYPCGVVVCSVCDITGSMLPSTSGMTTMVTICVFWKISSLTLSMQP
ncbi:hypothetical protein Droror1_Dr00013888 [Drosera rotundifolia]